MKRLASKVVTFGGVSLIVLYSALKGVLGAVPWTEYALFQTTALIIYFVLECIWSRSVWGISTAPDTRYVRNQQGLLTLESTRVEPGPFYEMFVEAGGPTREEWAAAHKEGNDG